MMKIFLTVLMMSTSVFATEMIVPDFKNNSLTIRITHAEPFDFDTFILSNQFNKKFTVVCSGNPFYGNKSSYIEYENFFGSHVADFKFKENTTCYALKEYLYAVFEAVDDENQIHLTFDRKSGLIERIILPEIDPFYSGEEEQIEDVRELATM